MESTERTRRLYRLTANKETPALNYRYTGKEVSFHILRGIAPSDDFAFLATEHDVIKAWSSFARKGFKTDTSGSAIKLWSGHYEQFGRVMLNLGHITRYRRSLDPVTMSVFGHHFPKKVLFPFVFSGPGLGVDDPLFYRSWFSLLNHPEFREEPLSFDDGLTASIYRLLLNLSFYDLNRLLRAQTNKNS